MRNILDKIEKVALVLLTFYPIVFIFKTIFINDYLGKSSYIFIFSVYAVMFAMLALKTKTVERNSKLKKFLNAIGNIFFLIACTILFIGNENLFDYSILRFYNKICVFLFVFTYIKGIVDNTRCRKAGLPIQKKIDFKKIFGNYTPPSWLIDFKSNFGGFVKNNKKKLLIVLVSIVGLVVVAFGVKKIYDYIQSKKPVNFSVSAEIYSKAHPEYNLKDELVIQFSGSVCELSEIGKTSDKVSISPAISGTWNWTSEDLLTFVPDENWKIGQKYVVKFLRGLVADHIDLKNSSVEFSTTDFDVSIDDLNFEIDDTNPDLKYATFKLIANMPFDQSSFDGKIKFSPDMTNPRNGTFEKKDYSASITFNDDRTVAYIRSEKLGTPAKDVTLKVKIAKGIKSELGGSAISEMSNSIGIPGSENYAKIENINVIIAQNDDGDGEQILNVSLRGKTKTDNLASSIEIYALPSDRPEEPGIKGVRNYHWRATGDISPTVLKNSKKLEFEKLFTENEYSPVQNFKIDVPEKTHLYVKVSKGVDFYGGYKLQETFERIVDVPNYEKKLEIMSDGILLSMKGQKKIPILSRGIDKLEYRIWRLKPAEINDIVSMSNGSMRNFSFDSYKFNEENVGELFTETASVQSYGAKKAVTSFFDFSKYLSTVEMTGMRNGIFLLKVDGLKENSSSLHAKRLILVTDLGIIVKKDALGDSNVFVQSIADGTPVPNVSVKVIAKNGDVLQSATTDNGGRVFIQKIDTNYEYSNLKPVAIVASIGNDLSFMPYNSGERRLDFSDFPVGGIYGSANENVLKAFVFSDRGIYRPGEEIRFGMITKAGSWAKNIDGLPCVYSIYNPNGNLLLEKEFAIGEFGFNDIKYKTDSNSLTGNYSITIKLKKFDKDGRIYYEEIGSESVKVEEFLPDTLEISTEFNPSYSGGWMKPSELSAKVHLRNLFGTDAVGNKVEAGINLKPGFVNLSKFKGFTFSDPLIGTESYSEKLETTETDANGNAEFFIDLEKFKSASYRLTFNAIGYEKESGRHVVDEKNLYVSPLDYLIGWKSDGNLSYVGKDAKRKISLIAVDNNLNKIAAKGIELSVIETKYVSVLLRSPNGVYKYQSVKKEFDVENKKIDISENGTEFDLPIPADGEFTIVIKNSDGIELNKIHYSVIGKKNIQRSLARTAELEVKAEKSSAVPGEELKLFIKAPYAGSGLICVERRNVYSYKWFKSDGNSSEQTVMIPSYLDGAEGNAYVTVLYKRASDSEEIYMSPFCYAAVPININLDSRTEKVNVQVKDVAKPGEDFEISYSTGKNGKVVIFAVDEGILNVAKYKKPQPLSFFFEKRALETSTYEMLDLILPEADIVKKLQNLSSMGASGGGEGFDAIGKNINPFKRRQNECVAYWSGILDSSSETKTVKYRVPEHFNGRLHVFAISVSNSAIGITEATSEIKADYVISANTPTFAAPNDIFDVPVTVTNTVKGSKNAKVTLSVDCGKMLELQGDKTKELTLDEGKDATVRFTFKALSKNGNADIKFVASGNGKSSKLTTSLSVRPSMPYQVWTTTGMIRKGENKKDDISVDKDLFEEYAVRSIDLSYLPSALSGGLKVYLSNYPYGCSEQLTSRAFPYLFADIENTSNYDKSVADDMIQTAFAVISTRQKSDGSIGYWTANSGSMAFLDSYCALFLTTAKEKGYKIPSTTFKNLLKRLSDIANDSNNSNYVRAFAIYVLTKNENVTTKYLNSLKDKLSSEDKMTAAGIFAASSYKMLGMDDDAKKLLSKIRRNANRGDKKVRFEDDLFFNSLYLALISEHFPDRIADISGELLENIQVEIENSRYNSLSSAYALIALEKYKKAVPTVDTGKFSVIEKFAKDANVKEKTLSFTGKDVFNSKFDATAKTISIKNDEKTNLYYQIVHSGFLRDIPKSSVKNGIEVYREFSIDGKKTNEFKVGDIVTVTVSLRSVDTKEHSDIAVVDMVPAGLEIDIASARKESGAWDSVDVREDRIVLYGTSGNSARTFKYKATALTSGTFTVPPLYAESMYNRAINAMNVQDGIKVVR